MQANLWWTYPDCSRRTSWVRASEGSVLCREVKPRAFCRGYLSSGDLLAMQLHQSDALIVPRPAGITLSLPNEPDFLCESCAWHALPWTLAK